MARGVVKLGDLEDALDFVSAGGVVDSEAYLCLETGKIHCYAEEFAEWEEPLPADVEDLEKYIPIPHKNELDLGKRLITRFVAEALPDELADIESMFRRRGAYRRFKDLLDDRGLLDRWYAFEAEARREALREWCLDNGLECVD